MMMVKRRRETQRTPILPPHESIEWAHKVWMPLAGGSSEEIRAVRPSPVVASQLARSAPVDDTQDKKLQKIFRSRP